MKNSLKRINLDLISKYIFGMVIISLLISSLTIILTIKAQNIYVQKHCVTRVNFEDSYNDYFQYVIFTKAKLLLPQSIIKKYHQMIECIEENTFSLVSDNSKQIAYNRFSKLPFIATIDIKDTKICMEFANKQKRCFKK